MILLRRFAVSLVATALAGTSVPASAQLTVFDPSNYSQNVLTAARALQQINNQITSLQNEAQMLINQARNLASLPYSSLLHLQQSVGRTQQLLAQAQGIAFDVQQIDQAFSTTYGASTSACARPFAATTATRSASCCACNASNWLPAWVA